MTGERRLTIGRGPDSDVRINDRMVSTTHASIIMDGTGAAWIEDEGSTNGTRLNGRTVYRAKLTSPDDKITVGHTTFTVRDLATMTNHEPPHSLPPRLP